HQRSIVQAIVFYFLFAFMTLAPLITLQLILNVFISDQAESNMVGWRIGVLMASVVPSVLSFAILAKKRLLSHPLYLLALVASLVLGYAAGVFAGLIVPAILSTRPVRTE